MKTLYCSLLLTIVAILVPPIADSAASTDAKPINAMCPIGKEPIIASAGTIEYAGKTIGLCCPGCGKAFLAWERSRRDAFVALAMRGEEPGQPHQESTDANKDSKLAAVAHTYPLGTCIVSGEELSSMGEPVTWRYEGREIRLCCRRCIETFRAEPTRFIEKLDKAIVATELKHYEIGTCIVAGGKLGSMGAPVNFVHNNRLVRFCCASCIPKFESAPAKFLSALDQQIIDQQSATYPLSTCVVAEAELGSMGDPVDYVHGNRLVRFCCASCIPRFEAEPAKYLDKIDTAYADAQRGAYPLDTCVVAGGALGSMGEPVEIIAGTRLVRFCCAACIPKFEATPGKYVSLLSKD